MTLEIFFFYSTPKISKKKTDLIILFKTFIWTSVSALIVTTSLLKSVANYDQIIYCILQAVFFGRFKKINKKNRLKDSGKKKY